MTNGPTDPTPAPQIEPDTGSGREPVLYSHIAQVIVSALGLGQWAVIDNTVVNAVLTAVWLVASAVIAAKTRGQVKPLPKDLLG